MLKGKLQPFAPLHPGVDAVFYGVSRENRIMYLHYELHGALRQLVLPDEIDTPCDRRCDGLWRHTCFELFLKGRGDDSGRYLEGNFAPSGDWNVYTLSGYRKGLNEMALTRRPHIRSGRFENIFYLDVELDCSVFMAHISQVEIGLSSVVEDTEGGLSYWALAHHGDKPDFHDARSFELFL